MVLRVVDAVSGFALFTFSGGWGAGTVGGALAVTTRERFNAAGFDSACELNETIVSTSDIRDARVHRQSPSVFCRAWDSRNVDADTIRSVEQIRDVGASGRRHRLALTAAPIGYLGNNKVRGLGTSSPLLSSKAVAFRRCS